MILNTIGVVNRLLRYKTMLRTFQMPLVQDNIWYKGLNVRKPVFRLHDQQMCIALFVLLLYVPSQ